MGFALTSSQVSISFHGNVVAFKSALVTRNRALITHIKFGRNDFSLLYIENATIILTI